MMTLLNNVILPAGAGWYFLNGILHDFFILRTHKGPYDRNLLRLLMDGHVLILSGLLLFAAWHFSTSAGAHLPYLVGSIVALGMIVYCAMIFPFLKSFVTLFLSSVLLIFCIYALIHQTSNNSFK